MKIPRDNPAPHEEVDVQEHELGEAEAAAHDITLTIEIAQPLQALNLKPRNVAKVTVARVTLPSSQVMVTA